MKKKKKKKLSNEFLSELAAKIAIETGQPVQIHVNKKEKDKHGK